MLVTALCAALLIPAGIALAQNNDTSPQPITWISNDQAYCWQPENAQFAANTPLVV